MTTTHHFSIDVELNKDPDDACEDMYARCNDVSFLSLGQDAQLGFDREADSLSEAVGSAIRDIESVGIGRILSVTIED